MRRFDAINDMINTISRLPKDDPRRHAMVRHLIDTATTEEVTPTTRLTIGATATIIGGALMYAGFTTGGWAHILTGLGGFGIMIGVSGISEGLAKTRHK